MRDVFGFRDAIQDAASWWDDYLCTGDDDCYAATVDNFAHAFSILGDLTSETELVQVGVAPDGMPEYRYQTIWERPELFGLLADAGKGHTMLLAYESNPHFHANMIAGILCESRWLQHPVIAADLENSSDD